MTEVSIKPDNTAHLISKARRCINLYLSLQMEEAGIQGFVTSHGDIIATLLKHKTMNMRELATAIQRDPSTVTTLVKKLALQGYVALNENPLDTRSRLVTLTTTGYALKDAFYPISTRLAETLWANIGEDERDQFRDTLIKIIHNFQMESNPGTTHELIQE